MYIYQSKCCTPFQNDESTCLQLVGFACFNEGLDQLVGVGEVHVFIYHSLHYKETVLPERNSLDHYK